MKRVFALLLSMFFAFCPFSERHSFSNISFAESTIGLGVEYRTQDEINSFINDNYAAQIYRPEVYETTPVFSAPYDPGSLKDEAIQAALNALNQARYVAGIDADVKENAAYSRMAQAGAFLNAVNGMLSHYPLKPEDMDDELYKLGRAGASSSNLAKCSDTLSSSVFDYLDDSDPKNISRVGHRRWVLNPEMGETGFGQAGSYYAMYAFDTSHMSPDYTAVAWPAQNMPYLWMNPELAWSVDFKDTIDQDNVNVQLVRKSDGQIWQFSSESADGEFYISGNCVIFRPDSISYSAEDSFAVTVSGALSEDLSYDVNLFMPVLCAEISGTYVDFSWNIHTDRTLVLSGSGDMPENIFSDNMPWTEYLCYFDKIVIEEGVTSIPQYGFYNLPNVTEVTFPVSLRVIDFLAFAECNNLTDVYFSGSELLWSSVKKENGNENLLEANIHFASKKTDLSLYGSVDAVENMTYQEKAIKPSPRVQVRDILLKEGKDYTLKYKNNKYVGTATITVKGTGDFNGSIKQTFKITKANQPMTVKAKTVTLKASKLKKKAQTVKVSKAMTIKKAQGTKSFKITSKGKLKKIKIDSKTGKITVPKGTKKGTYSIKVKVAAKGTKNYKKGSKTVKIKIKVK